MVKARGKVSRSTQPQRAYQNVKPVEPNIHIIAWCPDDEAKVPPEQVHFIFIVPGLEETPFVVRFKSPDMLGFLIEELTRYRRIVWPDAEPVELE